MSLFQRSCFSRMNPVRKRLRLSPSRTAVRNDTSSTAQSLRPPCSGPQLLSHDASLLPPPAAPAGVGAQEEEEEEGYLLVQEDTTDSSLIITMAQVSLRCVKVFNLEEEEEEEEEAAAGVELEIDRRLDQSLETKSKQHNLTTVNVRNIIHEVITNEHVVAMMKAAINETEAVPPFEPKMTRSKFKEVVEKGVVIPAWNISPIKKTSDVNKVKVKVQTAVQQTESFINIEKCFYLNIRSAIGYKTVVHFSLQTSRSRSRRLRAGSVAMGPPPPPKAPAPKVTDSTFLEKLHAVEEELAVCMEPYQPLSESEDEVGLMAYRTRSKRPLRDVPSTHEDREWTDWLRGLMTSDMDNEEECDDEDDPEYNFLADIDEPDQEDYRDDKAVRITSHGLGDDEVDDGPITELRTVKQQLEFMKKRRQLGLQTHTLCNTHTHSPEPYTLKLDGRQRSRLQQQLQQHVQLLTQVHLLSSPVAKLHSEAETTRQFLFELDLLAQRGELLMSSGCPGFCSVFRASNLQGALQLLEELRLTPIMRCYPVMPAELAWLFATRPVFLYPELLPCASLDPALYCPRRTAAFTAAEDWYTRAFRYQRVLQPMLVACRPVDPAERRPPVEREEHVLPLWLLVRNSPDPPEHVLCPDWSKRVNEYFLSPVQVCDAVQVCQGLSEQLLQVLDQFSAVGPSGAPELLYNGLRRVLRPWPQLLRDYAAFLNRGQARRCGLVLEQQLFERSRWFLRQLGQSLGESSVLYQQVVSVLQGSSAPSPEDMDKISSLLKHHPHLQEEFWEFFQQLHARTTDYVSQNPPGGNRKRVDSQTSEESETGSDRQEEEESERPLCAKNISMTSSGEKVVVWTREADRAILTACQQGGANRKTFRCVSAQLGNKTTQQVRGGRSLGVQV
uniref:Si:dkey-27c15.3 n=1 Tax=Dicentrarchus labrax TaxID=13489 RepID=A0A8P4KBN2_DICLA